MVELLIFSFGLARLLPEFIGASDDVRFNWLCHSFHLWDNPPGAGTVRGSTERASEWELPGVELRTVNKRGDNPFLSPEPDAGA